jgi:protein CWC15
MGHEEQGGLRMRAPSQMQSAKDMPAQMTMKMRGPGQGTCAELGARDFRAELEAKERKHFKLDKLEDFESTLAYHVEASYNTMS